MRNILFKSKQNKFAKQRYRGKGSINSIKSKIKCETKVCTKITKNKNIELGIHVIQTLLLCFVILLVQSKKA